MHPAILALITIILGVGGCIAYYYLSNQFLDKVLFPAKDYDSGSARKFRIQISFSIAAVPLALGFVLIVIPPLAAAVYEIAYGNGSGTSILLEDLFTRLAINRLILVTLGAALLAAAIYLVLPKGEISAGENINRANMIRPWLFLFPAIAALGLYLAYPVVATAWLSLNRNGEFVGFANYAQMSSEGKFWESMRNNMLWLIVVPAMATAFGLLAAQLTDRIWWGNIAKSLIFMPMAISFVGASVIWKLIYDARPAEQDQIGILNALYLWFGGTEPQQWLTIPLWNNFFLMIVLVWIQAGFAMVILSAALRGIPEETIEAAIIDGANPFQIFFKIKVPQIMGTIVVVWTTITITVLKVFDIVLAMTNGQWETQVLANYMYDKFFRAFDVGVGSAAAMIIMLLVTPILVWNVYNVRKEMR